MKQASPKSAFQPRKATVERVIPETPDIHSLLLRPEGGFRFQTGQFAMVTAAGAGEAPFAPSSPAREEDTVRITVRKTGVVYSRFHGLKPGEIVGIRGPYGKPFSLEPFDGLDLAFIVRGIGLAAARPFILAGLAMRERFQKIVLWMDPAGGLPYAEDIASWSRRLDVRTCEGEAGGGISAECVDRLKQSGIRQGKAAVLLFCGLRENRSAADALSRAGFPNGRIFLWTETSMDCAIGQCRRCTAGHLFICREGPLIPLAAVEEPGHFRELR
jgi:NAD(P)H-flavin reductase